MGFMSKGGQGSPPPPVMPSQGEDNTWMLMELMSSMSGMMESMMEMSMMPKDPGMAPLPDLQATPEVDWSDKEKQLLNKVKADYSLDEMRRKGRQDTILTSPLLDEEDATTTQSILVSE